MKAYRLAAAGLALGLLTGCASLLERSYTTSEPHSSKFWESEAAATLRAENRQDMVNDLLILVGQHTESAVIRLYEYNDDMTVAETLDAAATEVQQETAMGSYAVEYITYTVSSDNRPYSEIKLALGYRRTEEQVKSIVHATSISALHALLTAAAETSAEELVVQVGYFQDQAQEVRDIAVQVEQEVLDAEEPTWQVEFYPNESAAGIIEILMKN